MVLYGLVWSHMVQYKHVACTALYVSLWFLMARIVQYGPYDTLWSGPIWSRMVPYGPVWSRVVLYAPIWSSLVLYGTLWYCIVSIGPVRSLMVPYGPIWSRMVPYNPLLSPMVPYGSLWFCKALLSLIWPLRLHICLPFFSLATSAQMLWLLHIISLYCDLFYYCFLTVTLYMHAQPHKKRSQHCPNIV